MIALLIFAATQVVTIVPPGSLTSPDFVMEILGIRTPIHCAATKTNITVYEEMSTELTATTIAPLMQARLDGTIDEEQSLLLFQAESERAAMRHLAAAHRLASYYCEHRDKLPAAK